MSAPPASPINPLPKRHRSWTNYLGTNVPLGVLMAGLGAIALYFLVRPHLVVRSQRAPKGITRAFRPWDAVAALWYNGNSVSLQGRRPPSAVFPLEHSDGGRLSICGECVSDPEALGLDFCW